MLFIREKTKQDDDFPLPKVSTSMLYFCRDFAVGIIRKGLEKPGKHGLPVPWNMRGVWICYSLPFIGVLGVCTKMNTEFWDFLLKTIPASRWKQRGMGGISNSKWDNSHHRKSSEKRREKCLKKNPPKMQRNKSKIPGINTNVALIDPAFPSPAMLFFSKDKKPFQPRYFSQSAREGANTISQGEGAKQNRCRIKGTAAGIKREQRWR